MVPLTWFILKHPLFYSIVFLQHWYTCKYRENSMKIVNSMKIILTSGINWKSLGMPRVLCLTLWELLLKINPHTSFLISSFAIFFVISFDRSLHFIHLQIFPFLSPSSASAYKVESLLSLYILLLKYCQHWS